MSTWQPIDDAPTNGTPLFLFNEKWISQYEEPSGVLDGYFDGEGNNGWVIATWNAPDNRYVTVPRQHPTHWKYKDNPFDEAEEEEQEEVTPAPPVVDMEPVLSAIGHIVEQTSGNTTDLHLDIFAKEMMDRHNVIVGASKGTSDPVLAIRAMILADLSIVCDAVNRKIKKHRE